MTQVDKESTPVELILSEIVPSIPTFLNFIVITSPSRPLGVFRTNLPGIPARSHTFVEIDHEIISKVILLPSAESFKKGCCQLQAKVCARSTG